MARRIGLMMFAAAAGGIAAAGWHIAGSEVDISPVRPARNAGTAGATSSAPPPLPLTDKPLAALTETAARPLFHASRRPQAPRQAIAPASAPVAQPSRLPEGLRLMGVIVAGGERRALIRTGEEAARWIPEGGAVHGWTLSAVTASTIVLEAGGARHELPLYR